MVPHLPTWNASTKLGQWHNFQFYHLCKLILLHGRNNCHCWGLNRWSLESDAATRPPVPHPLTQTFETAKGCFLAFLMSMVWPRTLKLRQVLLASNPQYQVILGHALASTRTLGHFGYNWPASSIEPGLLGKREPEVASWDIALRAKRTMDAIRERKS